MRLQPTCARVPLEETYFRMMILYEMGGDKGRCKRFVREPGGATNY